MYICHILGVESQLEFRCLAEPSVVTMSDSECFFSISVQIFGPHKVSLVLFDLIILTPMKLSKDMSTLFYAYCSHCHLQPSWCNSIYRLFKHHKNKIIFASFFVIIKFSADTSVHLLKGTAWPRIHQMIAILSMNFAHCGYKVHCA